MRFVRISILMIALLCCLLLLPASAVEGLDASGVKLLSDLDIWLTSAQPDVLLRVQEYTVWRCGILAAFSGLLILDHLLRDLGRELVEIEGHGGRDGADSYHSHPDLKYKTPLLPSQEVPECWTTTEPGSSI